MLVADYLPIVPHRHKTGLRELRLEDTLITWCVLRVVAYRPRCLRMPLTDNHPFRCDQRGQIVNHQTHHRGQVHGMLSQAGASPPELDLIYYVRTL